MSQCIDKRFENMLHAFEMDMLNDHDRREFQLHLLACQHCFEKAQKLETVFELMRNDTDIQEIPRDIINEQPKTETPRYKPSRIRSGFWPRLIPTSVLAAAVIALLILKPWQFEIRSSQEAIAAENRLAILYFENLAIPQDPQKLSDITASLLIADLSESHFLQVVSNQRVDDILKLLGKDQHKITDIETATRIARKARAKWMLTGKILQVDPHLVLTTQIVDVSSGNLVASQQITGEEGEDVFALVDKLSILVKNDLSLPTAARDEPDRRIADVTTHSSLAYRYYLEGVVNYNRYYTAEAAQSFKKALELDSTFAMAYYYLSRTSDENMIYKAVEYSDRARQKDKHIIQSRLAFLAGDMNKAIRELQEVLERNPDDKEACYQIGICYGMKLEFEKAIQYFQMAIEIDPLYKTVYNNMAYTYDWMWEFKKAIQTIDMYISLAPEEPNPYDSRGDIYTRNGKIQLAINSYSKALELKPDFWTSLFKLGRNSMFLGKLTTADSCFRELAACDHPSWRSNGMAALAFIPLHQGRFSEAIRILDEGLATISNDPAGRANPLFNYLKAIAYEEKNNLKQAIIELEESIRVNRQLSPENKIYNQHLLAPLLAKTGNLEKAEEVTEHLRKNLGTANDSLRHQYAVASIDFIKGNLEQAIAGFTRAAEDSVYPYTPANFMLARACFEAERWVESINEFKKLNSDFTGTKLFYSSWIVMSHYFTGIAHEKLGHTQLAVEQYEIFLDLWKNVDSGITEIDDARKRLSGLKSKS